jgi:hypothetical protein
MAGGTLDNTVCSDSTNIGSIVPATHGFTVFSTAIPHVWTGADHVSILTCNQLVKVISKTLLDIVDVGRGSQTKPLNERMEIMRHAFLSGLEDRTGDESDVYLGNASFLDLKSTETLFLKPGERLVLGREETTTKVYLLPTVANADAFALLSDSQLGEGGRFEAQFCTVEGDNMACRSIASVSIPASTKNDIYPFSGNTFSFASFEFNEMDGADYLAIFDKGEGADFIIAEPFKKSTNNQIIHQSMLCKVYFFFFARSHFFC